MSANTGEKRIAAVVKQELGERLTRNCKPGIRWSVHHVKPQLDLGVLIDNAFEKFLNEMPAGRALHSWQPVGNGIMVVCEHTGSK